jgi:DMSO/TMAO reductase YedYZ molybdopterin-dependent catalytic subunit
MGDSLDMSGVLSALGKDPRLIPQQATNYETPLNLLDSFLTPNDRFFVRSNGPSAAIDLDPAAWRLTVSGCVERSMELSLANLRAMPQRSVTAFLECSGNSRSRFPAEPAKVEGTNWGNGAIGNAEWTGVSLADVLDRAGMADDAVDVVARGADMPGMQRGLPLAVARDPDVLLAWRMNGADLPAAHGGPVRLVVPGWGAIASTKWIVGLELIDHQFDGYWNADNYVIYGPTGAATGRVERMPVKSLVTSPPAGVVITPGQQVIRGFAWSGYGGVVGVEVSTDGGESWADAPIVAEAGPHAWVQFEYRWTAEPGQVRIQSRATDAGGNVQPGMAVWNAKGYQMNAIYEIAVTVRSEG